MNNDKDTRTPAERVNDISLIMEAATLAAQEAVERHRLLGLPVVTMRDGEVVWIQPEDIPPMVRPAPTETAPVDPRLS